MVDDKNSLSILRATHEYGDDSVIKKISVELCKYLDMVNLRSSMNATQIAVTAKLITERHPHLPIKAIELFFKDAMCGKFGDHYGRIDCSVIMKWMQQFENDYFAMCEEKSYAEHQSTKGEHANFAAIIHEHAEKESIPMPESLRRKFGLTENSEKKKRVRERIWKENAHLYNDIPKSISHDEKMEYIEKINYQINQLIKEELEKNGINN